jgi:hypothetical protein
VLVATVVGGIGLVLIARPAPASLVFLTAVVVCVAFAVFRASPVRVGMDLASGVGLFALAGLRRVERDHPLDTSELASLSAGAVPAIVPALPTLEPRIRAIVVRDLWCLREELRDEQASGWASFNLARRAALRLLEALVLPAC